MFLLYECSQWGFSTNNGCPSASKGWRPSGLSKPLDKLSSEMI